MLEDFVKWMASLPEFEREQKMEVLMSLFAPSPSHEDFKRLKGALSRKEKRISQLESVIQQKQSNTFDNLFRSICRSADYDDIKRRIVAAKLYKAISKQNAELRRKNKELQRDVSVLISKLHQPN